MRRVLLCLAALVSVAFTVSQLILGAPDGAAFATAVDRLEAQDVLQTEAAPAWVTVIALDGPCSQALVLRNSRAVAHFARQKVTVAVRPGDLLEVDGRAYRRSLRFRVTAAGPGLRAPYPTEEAITVGDIAFLARVQAR